MGEDLWPHPLPYYPREGGRHQPVGEVTERRRALQRTGEVGRPQSVVGGAAGECTTIRVEALQEGSAPAETEAAGLGEAWLLLMEDVVDVVEVVAEEQVEEFEEEEQAEEREEKAQERDQQELGGAPMPAQSPLEALKALQFELEPVNKQASRAFSRLKLRTWQRRKPHLEQRSTTIQGISGFWVKVFVNHPQMLAMMSDQDKDMLRYMTNLKVEELRQPTDCCKIMLFFRKNPYFLNEVIVKEYLVNLNGYKACRFTPIQWKQGFEREAYRRRHRNSGLNFFNWFSDHNFAGSSGIAEIISKDLWPNPLHYYLRRKALGEVPGRRTGEEPRALVLK
uniref:Testis-specific Y-encoded protein 3-like n=1 Tax=Sus scrofa TaxID=9823 RepID=A0A4X1TPU5_PIG